MEEQERKQLGLIADMDQLGAALRTVAPALAQFYRALLSEQLPPDAALDLTLQMQRLLFDRARGEY